MSSSQPAFASLEGVHEKTAATLERFGFSHTFPVQAAVIPAAVRGEDLLVQAPTGSGKTLAFGVPLIEQLPVATKRPEALVLVPTRELAVQVREDLEPIARGKQLRVAAVYGGASIDTQSKQAGTAAIVVATPGRLDDMIRNRRINVSRVRVVVLDEADRMLDMGFQPQVDGILPHLPEERQTMLFSATLEGPVAKLASQYTTDPQVVHTASQSGGDDRLVHVLLATPPTTKVDALLDALAEERDLAVVFTRTKLGADRVTGYLRERGVRATAIHGGMSQVQRTRQYRRFQDGACDVLVATDVFARGMDLDRITTVVNYDLPEDADTYRHRAGRTGRAGRAGTVVTLMLPKQRKVLKRMLLDAGQDPSQLETREPSGRKWPAVRAEDRAPERDERRERTSSRPAAGDGVVASYDAEKGFGFIAPHDGTPDVFFFHKQVSGGNPKGLRKGMSVGFRAQQTDRGPKALSVTLAGGRSVERRDERSAARPYRDRAASSERGSRPGGSRPGGSKPYRERSASPERGASSKPSGERPVRAERAHAPKAAGKPYAGKPSAKASHAPKAAAPATEQPTKKRKRPKRQPGIGPNGQPNRAARRAHLQRQV